MNYEEIKSQFPSYLTDADKEKLFGDVQKLSKREPVDLKIPSSADPYSNEVLQGDGWRGLSFYSISSSRFEPVSAMIISNSCDVDPTNTRAIPARITFCPIWKMSILRQILERSFLSIDRQRSLLQSIGNQRVTNLFYLPPHIIDDDDYVVRLDHIHSVESKDFYETGGREKLFTLSQVGFWLLTLKLSIHFCRIQEDVRRSW